MPSLPSSMLSLPSLMPRLPSSMPSSVRPEPEIRVLWQRDFWLPGCVLTKFSFGLLAKQKQKVVSDAFVSIWCPNCWSPACPLAVVGLMVVFPCRQNIFPPMMWCHQWDLWCWWAHHSKAMRYGLRCLQLIQLLFSLIILSNCMCGSVQLLYENVQWFSLNNYQNVL